MDLSLGSRADQDVHIFRASRASDLDECGYSRVIGMLSCVLKRVDMGEGTRYIHIRYGKNKEFNRGHSAV